jgi:hypothetical protein
MRVWKVPGSAKIPFTALSHATLSYSYGPFDGEYDEEEIVDVSEASLIYDPEAPTEDDESLLLSDIGSVDSLEVFKSIEEISDRYLSDIENDLIWLMRQGRRPVEVSRILCIPECEVVRLRRNCFRKIRTVYLYDYHHNKTHFLKMATALLDLNPKQERIFKMFFSYYGLRQIAETIGTRPSNVHRSLQMMRRKLQAIAATDEHGIAFDHFYLNAFEDFKYLCLTLRTPV